MLTGSRRRLHRFHAWVAAAGLALTCIGFYAATRPAIYAQVSFWTSSPTYFAIRVGVIMAAFAALYGVEQLANRAGVAFTALERFGRRSLFVYWIHVELVYRVRDVAAAGAAAAVGCGRGVRGVHGADVRGGGRLRQLAAGETANCFTRKSSRGMMPAVRALLASVCCFTIAASGWLAAMALVLGRPGYQALVGLAFLFVLQSVLTIWFISGSVAGKAARGVLMAGATGLVGAGGRAVAVNVTRVHFEGYAVVIAVMLVAQGLLTLWTLYARRRHVLGRTAPIW